MMEALVQPPTPTPAPSTSLGGILARKLLACTTSMGCTASAYTPYTVPEAENLALALGSRGFFTVRREGSDATVVARGKVPISGGNEALFGTELSDETWTYANGGGHFVFLYGYPVATATLGNKLKEASVENLAYSFNRWPDSLTPEGKFVADDIVHVFVCLNEEIDVPHLPGVEHSHGRMQRESTLLSEYDPAFCPKPTSLQASVAAPMKQFAMSLLPKAWSAMFFGDVKTPVIGGSAYDFSDFAPVGANTEGKLVLTGPVGPLKVNQALGFVVQALSGGNTPMERVPVELYSPRFARISRGPGFFFSCPILRASPARAPYIQLP
jgi:hypothetical protein